ncbi:hypothetical protein MPTK1_7g03810 [Marchantia polymorpha subsp. ruderalis]|uniref:Bifunctional inhibitor/plant lipid transfer protein/seed storage helical domain-containing protein n=2 Tax=Marchantia polymorpha TaxID=3197 RepID=A0AAF6BVW1_MARPO|nr:hypothetical protein MARPO_0074s0016 [Marchantia polymorpha]BBN16145.1 hypothetical protein Mp_7g03810 [Marchantia polymorpha subsp. ruderalis]|eukprot:PTQ35020.1 hypothetical protein MARPO_0074s0016 [Marchantia polymorpha]
MVVQRNPAFRMGEMRRISRVRFVYALLLTYLIIGTTVTEALLPACVGNRRGILSPCKSALNKPHQVVHNSTCCRAVESFLFPGCLCLALSSKMPRSQRNPFPITTNATSTVHFLWEKCVLPLPEYFECIS